MANGVGWSGFRCRVVEILGSFVPKDNILFAKLLHGFFSDFYLYFYPTVNFGGVMMFDSKYQSIFFNCGCLMILARLNRVVGMVNR